MSFFIWWHSLILLSLTVLFMCVYYILSGQPLTVLLLFHQLVYSLASFLVDMHRCFFPSKLTLSNSYIFFKVLIFLPDIWHAFVSWMRSIYVWMLCTVIHRTYSQSFLQIWDLTARSSLSWVPLFSSINVQQYYKLPTVHCWGI